MKNLFSIYDWGIVAIYFAILVYYSMRKKGRENEEDYLLAGRKLTTPAFVATLVSTWYGGILGVGEYTYLNGISNWFVFGLPYYLFALIFALFFAKKIRKSNLITIPDQFQQAYGKGPAVFSGILLSIATLPAPYILMTGILISLISGLSFFYSVIIGTVFSLLYVYRGGFRLVVKTDMIQFLLMFSGFIFLFLFLNFEHFPFWQLTDKLPPKYFSLSGGKSWGYILAWYVIAAQTLIDPNFYQRCFAAQNPKTAQKGILISILFWIFFDFLTTVTGLYARALLVNNINAANTFPILGMTYLPIIFKGLFFTGLIATIMSTVDSFSFVSAISLGRDAISRLFDQNENVSNRYVRFSLLLTALLSLILIFYDRSIISLWFTIGSITIPPLLLPLLFNNFSKRSLHQGLLLSGMISASVITIAGIFCSNFYQDIFKNTPFPEQPLYLGLSIMLIFVIFSAMRAKTP